MFAKGVVAVGLSALLLTFRVPSRARADECTEPAQATEQVESLPPPGTCRLVRIGPQALVTEDDRGRFSMVDEPETEPRRGRVAGLVIGILTAGVVLTLDLNELHDATGASGGLVATPRTAPR
jgi:hypothetical protein